MCFVRPIIQDVDARDRPRHRTLYYKFNCDEISVQRLVLLSQLSPAGHREAIKLIDKMLRMLHTGKAHELRNPSAYVSTGVKNARDMPTPEGEYYRGKGTNK